jgi:hypothetical protein
VNLIDASIKKFDNFLAPTSWRADLDKNRNVRKILCSLNSRLGVLGGPERMPWDSDAGHLANAYAGIQAVGLIVCAIFETILDPTRHK